jgi:hypothetical protein
MNKAYRVVKVGQNHEGRLVDVESASFSLLNARTPRIALRHIESQTNLNINNIFIGPDAVHFTCEGCFFRIEELNGAHVPNYHEVVSMLRGSMG